MKYFVVLFFLVAAVSADWCDKQWCPGDSTHIACNNDGMPAARCPNDVQPTVFSQELIDAVLDEHNKLRNQQALGKTPGFAPAKRMATMTWDDKLANFAALNTLQCKMNHDECHTTETFYLAGQNLAGSYETDDAQLVRTRTDSWFDESKNCNMDEIRSHSSLYNANGDTMGHFTQVVRDEAYKVGCAFTRYTDKQANMPFTLMACNYAVSNIQGVPIYVDGPTASGCKTGTNPKYPGLCSENETYEASYFH